MAKKPKVATSGGRFMRIDQVCKPSKKKKKSNDSVERRDMDRTIIVMAQPNGRRLGRVDSLLQREAARNNMSKVTSRSKEEASLQRFGQGITKGKQKTKGTSKPPIAHSPTSQAHIDVFYAGSNKKWDVIPQVDPLKTCRVK